MVTGQDRPEQVRREVDVVEYHVSRFFFDCDERAQEEHDLLHSRNEPDIRMLILEYREHAHNRIEDFRRDFNLELLEGLVEGSYDQRLAAENSA